MAYVDNTILEDEQEQDAQGGPTIQGSAATSSAAPQTVNDPGAQKRKTPGNFADLSEYLRVNQSNKFGEKVAGKVGTDIDAGNQAVDAADTEFRSRVDANTIRDNEGLTEKLSQNPLEVNKDAFTRIRDAQYNGPKSLSDTQDLSSQVYGAAGTAIGKANATGSESGRFALLDSYFGRPQYNQGQKSLDNLLIQNDPNSQQAFAEMRNRAADLSSRSKDIEGSAQQYGGMGAQTTADTRSAARGALGIDETNQATGGGALAGAKKAIDDRKISEDARLAQEFAGAQAQGAGNKFKLDPAFLRAMGVMSTPSRGYGVDPSQFLSANSITKESAASPEDASRLRALQALGGQQDYLQGDDAQIGTSGNTKGFSFDADRYGKTVTAQKGAYQNELAHADAAYADARQAVTNSQGWGANVIDDMITKPQKYNLKYLTEEQRKQFDVLRKLAVDRQNIDAKYLGTMRKLPIGART